MKRILVTGATSGIGRQLAIDYALDGYEVVAAGRNKDKLEKLQSDIQDIDDKTEIELLVFDVTDKDSVQDALAKQTHIDCAILNAGVCEYVDDAKHMESELLERVFAANFMGMVYCTNALTPNMKEGSQLVIVDSMARLVPFTRAQAYGASKAAAHYFGNAMKIDLAAKKISVTTVSPGFVKTPMTDANDFEMPFLTTVEKASSAIRKGIAKKKQQIYFPRVFGWIMRFWSSLPLGLQLYLSRKLDKDLS